MTTSMTSFTRCSDEQEWGTLVWEIRSVNHRYLDAIIKLPEELRSLENVVRKQMAESIKRGKVECGLRYYPAENQQTEIHVNQSYADAILKACQQVGKKLHQPSEMDVLELLKWPGVIIEPEADLKPVMDAAKILFDTALNDLVSARKSEGQRLQAFIVERCETMKNIVLSERNRRPQLLEQTREKLLKRLEELKADYDKDRFEQELAYIAQKMDVDEELDRLQSHFTEIENIFKRNEPVGRRLDFLMQELNREANTLGSKSTDIETTQASVELKVLIEQMREQVQNIE